MNNNNKKSRGMFPANESVKINVMGNGDIEYVTPLPEFEVNAFKSDFELGPNASFPVFRNWYMKNQRNMALDRAKYARIGFAPLKWEDPEADFVEGKELKNLQRQFGDTIQTRHVDGFYDKYPHMESMDSALFRRLNDPMGGFSCINSQTNYYGPRFADKSNVHFEKDHYGFKPVSLDSLEKGDIVQLVRPWREGYESQRPFHAVMFDSYDDHGDINVWDQHGEAGAVVPEFKTYLHRTDDISGWGRYRAKSGYRFVGDEQTEQDVVKAFKAYQERNKTQVR